MVKAPNSYQSTSQGPQTETSTGTNMARDIAKGQWTDHYKQGPYTDVNRVWSTNASINDGNSQTQTQGFLLGYQYRIIDTNGALGC
ncbi:a127ecf4-27e7-4930-a126-2e2dcdb4f9c7 [Sclerotinia trifoliorum]|uniref:A127ecf4-27e7-4930-a126-2e2dcdb4f9c7 n=1 Tax=Sclerotinia trifoliorum TaxID=28548 RepID=A0A8H2ZMU6_9HELO|nr:a127ecf4-27e7-4930-a126-2e2dcdb4f9c7 [Sclerotinia trifoliorum]